MDVHIGQDRDYSEDTDTYSAKCMQDQCVTQDYHLMLSCVYDYCSNKRLRLGVIRTKTITSDHSIPLLGQGALSVRTTVETLARKLLL